MKKLVITDKDLKRFERIIDAYRPITKFPQSGKWKSLSNKEIWFWMINQVLVVGGSSSSKRFWQSDALKKQILYDSLLTKRSDKTVQKIIHKVLRETGARYSSVDINKCAKTKALLYNYKFVKEFKSGFKEVFEMLDSIESKNPELDRVYYLMDNLKYFKNKSARDFLMNLGMNQNTLAIDIRTQNIFQHLKIPFPEQQSFGSKEIYDTMEREIISKICNPLKIFPLHFDRILYQNYFKILKYDYLQIKLDFN